MTFGLIQQKRRRKLPEYDTQKIEKQQYYYKDLFTHTDVNTYINGVVKIC